MWECRTSCHPGWSLPYGRGSVGHRDVWRGIARLRRHAFQVFVGDDDLAYETSVGADVL